MNIAVIFAGGVGQRMNMSDKPKQFLEVNGKPILIYTLEKFQSNASIDSIILVSVNAWIDFCKQLIEEYKIDKVADVICGGDCAQQSIYNGLKRAKELYGDGHIVLIHDGVRPLIDEATIDKAIECVEEHGAAITVTPAIETITTDTVNGKIGKIIDRSECFLARAPQAFYLDEILDYHKKSIHENKQFIDCASMARYYGCELYTVVGPVENIKITTPMDFYMFRAIIDAQDSLKTGE